MKIYCCEIQYIIIIRYRLKLKKVADERKAEGEEGEVEKKIKVEVPLKFWNSQVKLCS